jgi:hypothetical protein
MCVMRKSRTFSACWWIHIAPRKSADQKIVERHVSSMDTVYICSRRSISRDEFSSTYDAIALKSNQMQGRLWPMGHGHLGRRPGAHNFILLCISLSSHILGKNKNRQQPNTCPTRQGNTRADAWLKPQPPSLPLRLFVFDSPACLLDPPPFSCSSRDITPC